MRRGGDTGSLPALAPGDEADLIARCVAGERRAHDEFYQRYRQLIAGNLYRVLGHRDELEDLTQEVFVIAFRGMATFRGDARLSTWLYRVCINVALGRMRTRGRRPRAFGHDDLDRVVDDAARDRGDTPETPRQALERARDRARVYRALDAMAPKKRLVLYLHEIEGRELKEIAYVLETNAITVRTRLFYARREFYEILAAQAATEEGAP
ncbi:MAG: sigma-70 family RNA polymerase sigma factor [Kofleriaceae bacterium]